MTLLDEVRRLLAEDARRRVTDTKPLYATAGAVDAAVDFLRRVPDRLEGAAERARVEWTPERFGDAFTDLVDDARDTADDAVRRLQQERSRITGPTDLAAAARDAAQQVVDEARKAPGRLVVSVAESAGAAFEAYDDLADRGRIVLAKLRGDAVPGETATSGRPGEQPPVFRRPTPTPTPSPTTTASPMTTGFPTASTPLSAPDAGPGGTVGHAVTKPPPGPAGPPNAAAPNATPPNVAAAPNAAPPNAAATVVVAPAPRADPAELVDPGAPAAPRPAKRAPARRPPAKRPPAEPGPAATTPPGTPPAGAAARRRPTTRASTKPNSASTAVPGSVGPGSPGVGNAGAGNASPGAGEAGTEAAPPNAARRAVRPTPPPGAGPA